MPDNFTLNDPGAQLFEESVTTVTKVLSLKFLFTVFDWPETVQLHMVPPLPTLTDVILAVHVDVDALIPNVFLKDPPT